MKNIIRKTLLGIIMLTVLLSLMGFKVTEANAESVNTGTVTATALNVRSGPSTSYKVIGTLSKGTKIELKSEKNGWYKVDYKGKTGYISGKYVKTEAKPKQESKNKGTITATSLNVRTGPSTSYNIIGVLKNGAKVELLATENGWYKINYNGKTGYISGKYVSTSDKPNTESKNKGTVTATELNVRTGPSTSYKVIGTLKKDAKVDLLSSENGWYKINYNGKTGYISGKYVSTGDKPVTISSSNSSNAPSKVARTMTVSATAYTGDGITSTGTVPKWGTIAVDPKVIPYGTKVYIPRFDKVFTAEDCGGAIKGNKIDIYMNSESECYNWGRRNIEIQILE